MRDNAAAGGLRSKSRAGEQVSNPPSDCVQRQGVLSAWLSALQRRSLPHFNQIVIWSLLTTALTLAMWPFTISAGPRAGVASLLFWTPDWLVHSAAVWYLVRAMLFAGVVLWFFQKCHPWSCWLVVVAFTALWSLHVETTTNTAHIFHMANMLLILQAIWITADAPAIKRALAADNFWTTPLVPRWLSLASIAYIGIFHTAAGLSKLLFSGPAWADGTSLQIWAYLWGRPWSPTTQLMLGSRRVTVWLQALTLVCETAGILAVIPRFRLPIGALLAAFYFGVLATFDYGFQFNALFTVLYFLPCEAWINRRLQAMSAE